MNLKALILASAAALALPAHAGLTSNVADIGNALTITFEDYDGYLTEGPEAVAPGVTFTGTAGSQLGAYIADLGDNGLWGLGNHFAATGVVGSLHFTFDDAYTSAAGAYLNSFDGSAMAVIAYGENDQILESYIVSFDGDNSDWNNGQFFGITRDSADIRAIAFMGMGLVADDMTYAAPVPEPETYAMMLAGLGLLGFMAKRRAK